MRVHAGVRAGERACAYICLYDYYIIIYATQCVGTCVDTCVRTCMRLYNSPLADSMHIECDSAPQAKKQNVYKTCNVCLKAFPSAHYLTKHKQEAGHKKK